MVKDITVLLRDSGFKVTPQRLAVYKALHESKEHPTAEKLFGELQPAYPTMSLATVYKTIEILAQLNLIKILNTGEDSFRYDADTREHAHIKCVKCQDMGDVMDLDIGSLINAVENKTGYEVNTQQLYFYGVCPKCRKKKMN